VLSLGLFAVVFDILAYSANIVCSCLCDTKRKEIMSDDMALSRHASEGNRKIEFA
jgi:hypothetical protein